MPTRAVDIVYNKVTVRHYTHRVLQPYFQNNTSDQHEIWGDTQDTSADDGFYFHSLYLSKQYGVV